MAIFLIKFVHTLVFFFMSACIAYVYYGGITRTYDWRLVVALAAVLLEGVVFLLSGRRCPLTRLAITYGDETGDDFIADIFLPQWCVIYTVPVSSVILFAGIVILVANYFTGG
jgi:hypothetical protein